MVSRYTPHDIDEKHFFFQRPLKDDISLEKTLKNQVYFTNSIA